MKRMKKLAGMMLAIIMVVAMTLPAFAAGDATIEIEGGADGSKYAAYKLLDATDSGETDEEGNLQAAYTINSKYETILKSATGKTVQADVIDYIAKLTTDGIRKFADDVYKKILADESINPDYTTEVNEFNKVDQGYYLIVETETGDPSADGTSDVISHAMLDTAGKEVLTVYTKEGVPTLTKKVEDANDSEHSTSKWQDAADYDIGDSVPFHIECTLPELYGSYETYYFAVHDEMSKGLTFKNDVTVQVEGTTISSDKYRVVTEELADGCTFEVIFDNLKAVSGITKDSVIVIEYTATLNEAAFIGMDIINDEKNINKAHLEFSNNRYSEKGTGTTPDDEVTVFTYQLTVNKVEQTDKGIEPLEGAGFTLYKYNGSKKQYEAVGDEITGVTSFKFTGLDAGTYKLEETTVPAGYNKAADLYFKVISTYDINYDDTDGANGDYSLVITDDKGDTISGEDLAFTVTLKDGMIKTDVLNQSGTELPSTGGIGTTIFYVLGSILVVGAVVIMVTKKRMKVEK